MVCWLNLSFFLAAKMPGDSDIEELPDIDDDLAEYGDLDAVLREGKQNTFLAENILIVSSHPSTRSVRNTFYGHFTIVSALIYVYIFDEK
jgi:hypothetical protein